MLSKAKELLFAGAKLDNAKRELQEVIREKRASKVIARELSLTLERLNTLILGNAGKGKGVNKALEFSRQAFVEQYKMVQEGRDKYMVGAKIIQLHNYIKSQTEVVQTLDTEWETMRAGK